MKVFGIEFKRLNGQKNAPENITTHAVVNKADSMPLRQMKNGKLEAIIDKIAKSFKDKSRKDIDKWRMAIMAADRWDDPRFQIFCDLVDDLKTDGTFKTQVQLRKSATLSTGFQIRNKKTGEVNELATELFNQQWFFRYLNVSLDATIYGTRIIEFFEFNNHNITFGIVPPRNVVPTQKRIYPDLNSKTYIDYSDALHKNWVIELNSEEPLGLVNDIIPNLIWKRNVAQSWMEFCEKFGNPLVSATTNNSNQDHLDNVEKQLLALAEASVGVFPEGTTIKFDEAKRTDAYGLYSEFIKFNKDEISGAIVGSNTLTQENANRSQTEVHERTLDYKISQADRRDIKFNVNDDLIPILIAQGYNYLSADDVFEWVESKEELDLNKYWTIVQGIMQEHEVEQEWLAETFNVPITGKKKVSTELIDPLVDASWNRPDYPKSGFPSAAGGNKILDELTETLTSQVWNGESTLVTEAAMIVEESLHLIKGLKSGYGTFVAYNTPDVLAYQMMEYNLFEFSASKTEARLAAMTGLLIDKEKLEIRSFSQFKELALKEVESFNHEWLETEYNLSIAVGQNSAAYNRFLSEKDTVTPYVQYQTVGDTKVRDQHALLDGVVFNLNDKEAMQLWPPNGFGCRCEMIQFIHDPEEVMSGTEGKRLFSNSDMTWKDSQFAINRGDLKEVFTTKQFYSKRGIDGKFSDLTFDKHNQPSWDKFKSNLNNLKLDETITADNASELFKIDGKAGKQEFMGFDDYLGRKMILKKDSFKKHTSGHYLKEDRHRLFPHIQDVLKNPDEVWLTNENEKKYQTIRYVKFYKNKTIVVSNEITNNHVEIKTWYEMKDEKKTRSGLLINKKS